MGCRWGRESEAEGAGGAAPVPHPRADPEDRALFLGLDRGGKTTILRRLFNESVLEGSYLPTQGVNTKSHVSGDPPVEFMALEVGGQQTIRLHWAQFLDRAHGLVYVIDSTDTVRQDESTTELQKLFQDGKLANVPMLIFVNKIDQFPEDSDSVQSILANIRNVLEPIAEMIHKWHLQPCSGRTGAGLKEGMEWLRSEIKVSRAGACSEK